MRYRLLALLTIVAAALAIASPAQAASSCRKVEVDTGGSAGEQGAYAIRATAVSCTKARRLLRRYLLTGDVPIGWGLIREGRFFVLERNFRPGRIRFRAAS